MLIFSIMKISVIVAVYNRYKHLACCLNSLSHQTFKDFEVIVADDGSSGENLEKIKDIISDYSRILPIQHIWHEDKGFQKTLILNKAVKKSIGELLIFLDCDVIFNSEFISRYYNFYIKYRQHYNKLLLTGDVIFLKEDISTKILENSKINIDDAINMIKDSFTLEEILYRESRYIKYRLYKLFRNRYPKGWGANMAVSREAFLSVNGFNNDFTGRGEDTDFMKRVVLKGSKRIGVNTSNISYHLYHKMVIEPSEIRKKTREKLRWDYFKENPDIIFTPNGFDNL